jgi:ring-1,2-phenylacetyl-CoA epoxidase subunit PaaE
MAVAADFQPLRISAARLAQGDALVLTFDVPQDARAAYAFKPGQHVALRTTIDGQEVRRNYSICVGPNAPLQVAIKRVADGIFSSWAHAQLKAGMTVDVMPPSGRFILTPPTDQRSIVLFAAGSGITPCLGIVQQALEHDRQTRVTLIYGNHGRDTTMFAEELEALKDKHLSRFELIHLLSREGEADVDMLAGRITAEKVRALGERLVDYVGAERIFVCGPGSMIKDVRDTLFALGVARERVTHEFFAAGGGAHRAAKSAAAAQPVAQEAGTEAIAILDDVRHRLTVQPGETLLAAALRAGLKAPYSCSGGMCATCRAKIVDGKAEMLVNYSLEPWEMERGFVLTCQAVPKSAKVIVDWDAM